MSGKNIRITHSKPSQSITVTVFPMSELHEPVFLDIQGPIYQFLSLYQTLQLWLILPLRLEQSQYVVQNNNLILQFPFASFASVLQKWQFQDSWIQMDLKDKKNNYHFKTKASLVVQALKSGSNAAKQLSDAQNIVKSLSSVLIILAVFIIRIFTVLSKLSGLRRN